jgi:3',5'-cyclic AMP phosphodiesterase CpdA
MIHDRRTTIPLVALLAVLLALASFTPVMKAVQQERPAAVASESYPPRVFPDRIILTFSDDPSRTQSVTWRTDNSVRRALAEIAPADAGPQFESEATSVPAESSATLGDGSPARYHSVVFKGLRPATQYLYRVGDGTHWSEWSTFRTASSRPEPFRFLYVGDAQNSIKSHWSRVIRAAFADAPDARFIIHAGDLVDRGTNDTAWGEWHQAAGWINAVLPSLPAPGNHEHAKASGANPQASITPLWRDQFTLPLNGPRGMEETAYYVDYQGVRVVVLNSNENLEGQAQWLREILDRNPNRWTIASFHHPVYSSARRRDNIRLRKAWQPLFDLYHVDLVLQGHDHTYSRTGLQTASAEDRGTVAANSQAGTVYVNSVSGPKQYQLEHKPEQRRTAEGTQLYQIISVNGDRLRLDAYTALGDLYDAFEIIKREGLPNELIEKTPPTPERHPAPSAPRARAAATDARGSMERS